MIEKKLSPKLAEKQKRNNDILSIFNDEKKNGSMTMGVVESIQQKYASKGQKISVSTILRIVRTSIQVGRIVGNIKK